MNYIITFQDNSKKHLLDELKKNIDGFKNFKILDSQTAIFETELSNTQLIEKINELPIIFARHIFCVDLMIKEEREIIDFCLNKININKSFTLQYRKLSPNNFELTKYVSDALIEKGYRLDVKNAEQIISVVYCDNKYYVGLGNATLNITSFKGGMPHFNLSDNFISRAEGKLLEAINIFDIKIDKNFVAADLGAAPGGWTKVLAERCKEVFAIDPAVLDDKLSAFRNIKHYKMTTQKYIGINNEKKFDIVVNDMKIDSILTAKILCEFSTLMKSGTIVIATLKLVEKFSLNKINETVEILKKQFNIINIRQLFHNRSEVTLYCKKI